MLPGKGVAMNIKAFLFSVGCLVTWVVLLPLLVLAGGVALVVYAVFGEVAAAVTGNSAQSLDSSAARDIARSMCSGYAVKARATPRNPSV
jgi:hypothetical protein